MLELRGNLDLAQEPRCPDRHRQVFPQHLDGDLPPVLQIVREINGRHTAGTKFALDAITIGQRIAQAVRQSRVGHALKVMIDGLDREAGYHNFELPPRLRSRYAR